MAQPQRLQPGARLRFPPGRTVWVIDKLVKKGAIVSVWEFRADLKGWISPHKLLIPWSDVQAMEEVGI